MAETVRFTTVGWTDTGQGWRRERHSSESVSDQYWGLANDHLNQFVPQPPESLQDLAGIPIWSLSSVSVRSADDHWCFTVQSRGTGHRAGTVQFGFVDGRHPASVVWRAAATLVGDPEAGNPDRLPWGATSVTVPKAAPAVPGDPAAFEKATADLLIALLGPLGLTIVPAGPELMAAVLPAALAVVPPGVARRLRWHTCLLQPAKSAKATQTTVVGEWSPQMRRMAGPAASEVTGWLEAMNRPRPSPGADAADLVGRVARGLATGSVADPAETAKTDSVRAALERTCDAWYRPEQDFSQLLSEGSWSTLLAMPERVRQYAATTPHAAAQAIRTGRTRLDTGVAALLFHGLAGHVQTDQTVADALGLPSANGAPSEGYQDWLGRVVQESLTDAENAALIEALIAPGGRWHDHAARIAAARLFRAMGYTPETYPELYPFDAAGLAARIEQSDTVSDDVGRVLLATGDPLGAVRAVADHLGRRSARLCGGLLAHALHAPARAAGFDQALYALVKAWVDEQARSGGPTPPEWWARMSAFADRVAQEPTRAASDRAILVDAGLASLLEHGYDERDVLVSVANSQTSTLGSHLANLGGAGTLTPGTAALVAQLLPLWQDEHRDLVSAQNELAATRQQLALAQQEARAASRSGRSDPEHEEPGERADAEPERRSRLSSLLPPFTRDPGDGPRHPAGAGMITVVAVTLVLVVVAVGTLVGLVLSRDDDPETPNTGNGTTTTATDETPAVPTASGATYDGETVTLTVSGLYSRPEQVVVLLAQYDPNDQDAVVSAIPATIAPRKDDPETYTAYGTFPPHRLGTLPVKVWVLDPVARPEDSAVVLDALQVGRDQRAARLIEAASQVGKPTTTVNG
ncbi:hypothetical protein [Cryptosporangium aurantiacum]|uniref:Uncharacterized protein n=1 Tax=Cryptosporangium aurantiacum TaxID=134849 RepID=A0A1M7RI39_9ACTN|nr:hypothetical protein [Cryptosporangium aurantiacum]SHN45832.1 hypothetical protein SAMN05443668_11325 [Cryptosporangium aurantiacum]